MYCIFRINTSFSFHYIYRVLTFFVFTSLPNFMTSVCSTVYPQATMCGCRSCLPTQRHERAGFVWLWAYGVPIRNIAVLSGTSITTVYRWIRRWQEEGHVNSRPKSGRMRLGTRKGGAPVQLRHLPSPSSWLTPASLHSLSPYYNFQLCQVAGWTPEGFIGGANLGVEPKTEC